MKISQTNLEFWNCLQWYVRKITLVCIEEWAKAIHFYHTERREDDFLNDFLPLLAIHPAASPSNLYCSLQLFPTWDNSVCSDICQAAEGPGTFPVCLLGEVTKASLCCAVPSHLDSRQMSRGWRIARNLLGPRYDGRIGNLSWVTLNFTCGAQITFSFSWWSKLKRGDCNVPKYIWWQCIKESG